VCIAPLITEGGLDRPAWPPPTAQPRGLVGELVTSLAAEVIRWLTADETLSRLTARISATRPARRHHRSRLPLLPSRDHGPQLPHQPTTKHHHPHATHENTRLDRTTRTTGRSKLNPISTRMS